jgi:8-oxo-dGTP pyrophosphatase MutT (NUDIX family)
LAYQEILEETGLRRGQLRLVGRGTPYRLRVGVGVESLVQPFLFESATRRIKLNWEHTESKWIKVADLRRFRLIPRFDLSLKALDLV